MTTEPLIGPPTPVVPFRLPKGGIVEEAEPVLRRDLFPGEQLIRSQLRIEMARLLRPPPPSAERGVERPPQHVLGRMAVGAGRILQAGFTQDPALGEAIERIGRARISRGLTDVVGEEATRIQAEAVSLMTRIVRVAWKQQAVELIAGGGVDNAEQALEMLEKDSDLITDTERQFVRGIFEQIAAAPKPEPDEASKVKLAKAIESIVRKRSVSTLGLVAGTSRSLAAAVRALSTPQLPPGIDTPAQLRQIAIDAGNSEAEADEFVRTMLIPDLTAAAIHIREQNAKWSLLINDVSGRTPDELQELIRKGYIDQILQQGALGLLLMVPVKYWIDAMAPTRSLATVTAPYLQTALGGGDVIEGILRANKQTEEWLALRREALDLGGDQFDALAYALEHGNFTSWQRLIGDLLGDPFTYWGFGIFYKTIPATAPFYFRWLAGAEKGFVEAIDLGALAAKRSLTWLGGKTIAMASVGLGRHAAERFVAISTLAIGKTWRRITMVELRKLVTDSVEEVIEHPDNFAPANEIGRLFLTSAPVDEIWVTNLARDVGSTLVTKLDDVTPVILKNIDDIVGLTDGLGTKIYTKSVLGTGQDSTAVTALLEFLEAVPTDAAKLAAWRSIKLFQQGVRNKVDTLLGVSRPRDVLGGLMNHLADIRQAQMKSASAIARSEQARWSHWVQRIPTDALQNIQAGFDRFNRAWSRQYLLFPTYGPFNIIEMAMKSALSGNGLIWSVPMRGVGLRGFVRLDLPSHRLGISTVGLDNVPIRFAQLTPVAQHMELIESATSMSRVSQLSANTVGNRLDRVNKFYQDWLNPLNESGKLQDMFIKSPGRIALAYEQHMFDQTYLRLLRELFPTEYGAVEEALRTRFAPALLSSGWTPPEVAAASDELLRRVLTGNEQTILEMAESFTAQAVDIAEVSKILAKYQQLGILAPDLILQELDAGTFFTNFARKWGEVTTLVEQELLYDPHIMRANFKQMVDRALSLPPQNLDEFVVRMQELGRMVESYQMSMGTQFKLLQREGEKYMNVIVKNTVFTRQWDNVIEPLIAEAHLQTQRLVEHLNTIARQKAIDWGLTPTQLDDYLKFTDASIQSIARTQEARLAQHSLERDLMVPYGGHPPTVTQLDPIRRSMWWNKFTAARHAVWERELPGIYSTVTDLEALAERIGKEVLPFPRAVGGRSLTAMDVAHLYQTHPHDLVAGMTEPARGLWRTKDEFIERMYKRADRAARKAGQTADSTGYTRQALGDFYDSVRSWLPDEPVFTELESLRQELEKYAMKRGLIYSPEKRKALEEAVSGQTVTKQGPRYTDTEFIQAAGGPKVDPSDVPESVKHLPDPLIQEAALGNQASAARTALSVHRDRVFAAEKAAEGRTVRWSQSDVEYFRGTYGIDINKMPSVPPVTLDVVAQTYTRLSVIPKNRVTALNELQKLQKQGVDTDLARASLDDYTNLNPADFTTRAQYRQARAEAWDDFLESVKQLDGPVTALPPEWDDLLNRMEADRARLEQEQITLYGRFDSFRDVVRRARAEAVTAGRAAVAESLVPPVPPGMVRLYRGAPIDSAPTTADSFQGRWFTRVRGLAEDYADQPGYGLRYVDVTPEQELAFESAMSRATRRVPGIEEDVTEVALPPELANKSALYPTGEYHLISVKGEGLLDRLKVDPRTRNIFKTIATDDDGAILDKILSREEQQDIEDLIRDRIVSYETSDNVFSLGGADRRRPTAAEVKKYESEVRRVAGKPSAQYDPNLKGFDWGVEAEWKEQLVSIARQSSPEYSTIVGMKDEARSLVRGLPGVPTVEDVSTVTERIIPLLDDLVERLRSVGYRGAALNLEGVLDNIKSFVPPLDSEALSNLGNALHTNLELELGLLDDLPAPVERAIRGWFETRDNAFLQQLGPLAEGNPRYLEQIHAKLYQRFTTGYLRVYRGKGAAGEAGLDPLDRVYTNTTTSKATAEDFAPANSGAEGLDWEDVIIRIEDVVSIGSAKESELIVRSEVIRQRMAQPLRIPQPWQAERQKLFDRTNDRVGLDIPDRETGTIVNSIAKTIFPFWSYEGHRWPWLFREYLRHPGVGIAHDRFLDNTDMGYITIPGTDMQINILRGTIFMGGMRRLMMQDFPEYYDNFPGVANGMDWLSRFGFYPNVVVGVGFAVFGSKEPNAPMQFGELIPQYINTPIDAYVAAFPQSNTALKIRNTILNNRFWDYLNAKVLSGRGVEGFDLLTKLRTGTALDKDELALWQSGFGTTSGYNTAFNATALFRLRPQEQEQFVQSSREVIAELTGISIQTQKEMQRAGLWLEDYAAIPPQWRELLRQVDGYSRWSGTTTHLKESQVGQAMGMIRLFWNEVDIQQQQRATDQLSIDKRLALNWLEQPDPGGRYQLNNWDFDSKDLAGSTKKFIDILRLSARYQWRNPKTDKLESVPVTLDERIAAGEALGSNPIILHAVEEFQNLYYRYEPEDFTEIDPDSRNEVISWDKYFRWQQAAELGIPEEYHEEVMSWIRRRQTTLQRIRRSDYEQFIRPYKQVRDVVKAQFTADEQKIITQWEQERDFVRREEFTEVLMADGKTKLISNFSSRLSEARTALRTLDPEMDARLLLWQEVGISAAKTTEAQAVFERLKARYGSLVLAGYGNLASALKQPDLIFPR